MCMCVRMRQWIVCALIRIPRVWCLGVRLQHPLIGGHISFFVFRFVLLLDMFVGGDGFLFGLMVG